MCDFLGYRPQATGDSQRFSGYRRPATGDRQTMPGACAPEGDGLRATGDSQRFSGYRRPATGARQMVADACPFRSRLTAFVLIAATLCVATADAADDAQALLAVADAYRLAHESAQVETEVVSMKNGAAHKERRYTVFQRGYRRSLVLMRSPMEKGQKVLMLGDDYWLILPKSQRPLRITPMQKLLGEASTGDIATMRWAGDYDGSVLGTEPCGGGEAGDCTHLSLRAVRKGVTYARVELWISATNAAPIRADLYLASEKLAKRAKFVLSPVDGRLAVTEMHLTDEIQAGRETLVRYLSRVPREAPDEWFNPMFLTRTEPGA